MKTQSWVTRASSVHQFVWLAGIALAVLTGIVAQGLRIADNRLYTHADVLAYQVLQATSVLGVVTFALWVLAAYTATGRGELASEHTE